MVLKRMYKIIKNGKDNTFKVVEIATNQTFSIGYDRDVEYKKYRHLKSGIGFAGWTPAFMFNGDFKPPFPNDQD